jgi:hypothetical protein
MHKFVLQVDATIAKNETEAVAERAQIDGKPLGPDAVGLEMM